MKKFILLLSAALLSASCTKELTIDVDFTKETNILTVNNDEFIIRYVDVKHQDNLLIISGDARRTVAEVCSVEDQYQVTASEQEYCKFKLVVPEHNNRKGKSTEVNSISMEFGKLMHIEKTKDNTTHVISSIIGESTYMGEPKFLEYCIYDSSKSTELNFYCEDITGNKYKMYFKD